MRPITVPNLIALAASQLLALVTTDRAGREEVAGAQTRTVDRHVREHLRRRPVQRRERWAGDDHAVQTDLELEIESAGGVRVVQVRQGLR